nr:PREDICTED: luciferin 4-monooxygenase-like [Linepithema humile]
MYEQETATDNTKVQSSKFKGTIKDNILIGPECPIYRGNVTISETILNTFKSKPDFVGQIDAITGKHNTFGEMSERSIKCALWLKKQGVKPGDVIGFCTDNNLDSILALLGTMYLGAIYNTWDHKLSPMTAKYFLSLTSPTIIFSIPLSAASLTEAAKELKINVKIVVFDKLDGYESFEDILKNHDSREITEFKCAPLNNLDEIALIVLSSGTTGMPKATEISHSSIIQNCMPPEKIKDVEGHIFLLTSTIRWQHGVTQILRAILAYSTRIVLPDIAADGAEGANDDVFCDIVQKYGITLLAVDPFLLIRFIKTDLLERYQLPTVKKIFISGSIFRKQHQEEVAKKLPHVLILNVYGSTDAGGVLTQQNKYSKPGSIGFVISNVRMKVANVETGKALEANKVGELRVKVPFVMNGYHKDPEATKRTFDSDGWLCTGDMGYYDEDGELFVIDRISEFIIFRSINVSPAEIETVLYTHPAVFQAVVIGKPHEIDGQHPMAAVSLMPGKTVSEQELISFVEKNLPDHCKLRAGVKFLNKLPRTTTGKISKKQLRDMFVN